MKTRQIIAAIGMTAFLFGCSAATQNIPVSSTPVGAQVLSDGKEMCVTPCSVELEKTQAHILTLKKQGYQDANVQIARKYDTVKTTRNAVETGMFDTSNGGNVEGAVANALFNVGADEESGAAYVLSPSSVVVKMVPEGQAGTAQVNPQAPAQAQVQTTEPATMQSAVQEHPEEAAEALLEGAAAASPTIGTKKTLSSSHHSSGGFNSDGSYSEHSSSSSTSVGVSVNPAEAGLGLLHLLEGEEAKKKAEETNPKAE